MEIADEHVRRTFLPDIPNPKLTAADGSFAIPKGFLLRMKTLAKKFHQIAPKHPGNGQFFVPSDKINNTCRRLAVFGFWPGVPPDIHNA